jgi:hypothetical protein
MKWKRNRLERQYDNAYGEARGKFLATQVITNPIKKFWNNRGLRAQINEE